MAQEPLCEAARIGDLAAVKRLVAAGVGLEVCVEDNETPVHIAASLGHADVVEFLADCGADCRKGVNNDSALHAAIKGGHLDCVKVLMWYNSPVCCALATAVASADEDVLRYMLGMGVTFSDGQASEIAIPICVLASLPASFFTALLDADVLEGYLYLAVCGACDTGNVEYLRLLIRAGVRIAPIEEEEDSCLHLAVCKGHDECVRELLVHGVSVDALDDGETALTVAAGCRQPACLELLLEAGADMGVPNDEGHSPLRIAARESHDCLRVLIGRGALELGPEQRSLLAAVAESLEDDDVDTVASVALLVEYGVSVDEPINDFGVTLLYDALEKGRREMVVCLLGKGASVSVVDHEGNTMLHAVTGIDDGQDNERAELVRMLLKRGAAVDARNEDDMTPLHFAALGAFVDTSRELIAAGAPIDARNTSGDTPLAYAVPHYGTAALCATLIKAGADVNTTNGTGSTPLLAAAGRGAGGMDRIKILVEAGADVHAADNGGNTFLTKAVSQGSTDFVRYVLSQGVDLHAPGNCTALHMAAEASYPDIMQMLIDYGADKSVQDEDGRTAMDIATEECSYECCRILRNKKYTRK